MKPRLLVTVALPSELALDRTTVPLLVRLVMPAVLALTISELAGAPHRDRAGDAAGGAARDAELQDAVRHRRAARIAVGVGQDHGAEAGLGQAAATADDAVPGEGGAGIGVEAVGAAAQGHAARTGNVGRGPERAAGQGERARGRAEVVVRRDRERAGAHRPRRGGRGGAVQGPGAGAGLHEHAEAAILRARA